MSIRNGVLSLKQILDYGSERKPDIRLFPELAKWMVKNKGAFYYFYLLGLHKKGKHIKDYITDKEYLKIHNAYDPVYYRPMLEDKIIFDRYINSFGIPSPPLIGIIENGSIIWADKKETTPIEELLKYPMHAFCKHVTSWGGKNIYKIEVKENKLWINKRRASLDTLKSKLGNKKFILQEEINQHKILNKLNPHCVNTIRVYTLHDGVHPIYFKSFLRIGVRKSIVDNVSNKNLAVGISNNHYLFEKAYKRSNPPIWMSRHPDTKVKFSEFRLPYFEEAKELCRSSHEYFSDFLIIAWDVAISKNGPVLLEGNPAPSLTFLQVLYGGLKDEFMKCVKSYKEIKAVVEE